MTWWERDAARGPLATRAGIEARSRRGRFGQTPWGQAWEDLLEAGGRTSRARSYARKGQVVTLRIEAGAIRATIQGSRDEPYAGSIAVEVFPEPVWEAIIEAVAADEAMLARVLDVGLDASFAALIAERAGAALVPPSAAVLRFRCDCPDWGVPCKHLAAVHLLVAEQIDADPSVLLTLRGMRPSALIERMLAAAQQSAELAAARDDLSADPARFWGDGLEVEADLGLRLERPSCDAGVVDEMGALPFWQAEAPLREIVAPLYRGARRRGLALLQRDEPPE